MPLTTTPCDWALDADGDVEIPLRYTRGLEAVAQSCRINLLVVRGEWFANLDVGVRWMPNTSVPERLAILGGRFSRARLIEEARNALLASFGVSRVDYVDVDFDAGRRHASIRWRTTTVWGDTVEDTLTMENT